MLGIQDAILRNSPENTVAKNLAVVQQATKGARRPSTLVLSKQQQSSGTSKDSKNK